MSLPKDENKKERLVLVFSIILFYAFFTFEAIKGNIHFINKAEIYIVVLIFLLIIGKTREFLKDWAFFIAILYLFDSLRGFAFLTIVKYHRRYFMMYVVKIEEFLLGGKTLPNILQHYFWTGKITFFEKFLATIHASHFLIFIVVGIFIWIDNREKYYQYISGLSLIMIIGAMVYIFLPTAPPWIASRRLIIPYIKRILVSIYKEISPSLITIFDINPVAAMPSLHAAFPFFIFLFSQKNYKLRYSIISFLYFLIVFFTIGYCGEHYLTDVIAGCIVSIIALLIYPKLTPYVKKIINIDSNKNKIPVKIFLISLIIIFFSSFLGKITNASQYFLENPDFISMSYIEKELEGNSILAEYYKAEYYLMTKSYHKAILHAKKAIEILKNYLPECKEYNRKIYVINLIQRAKTIYARAYVLKNKNNLKKQLLKGKIPYEIFDLILKEGEYYKFLTKKDVLELKKKIFNY